MINCYSRLIKVSFGCSLFSKLYNIFRSEYMSSNPELCYMSSNPKMCNTCSNLNLLHMSSISDLLHIDIGGGDLLDL